MRIQWHVSKSKSNVFTAISWNLKERGTESVGTRDTHVSCLVYLWFSTKFLHKKPFLFLHSLFYHHHSLIFFSISSLYLCFSLDLSRVLWEEQTDREIILDHYKPYKDSSMGRGFLFWGECCLARRL